MIAACPKCGARYRIDPARLGEDGARLRCTRCEAVFRVRAPSPAHRATMAPVRQEPRPEQETPSVTSSVDQPENAPPPEPAERERLVVVAHPDVESARATAQALQGWGLTPHLASDGVEAILTIQRKLPRVVVLAASLPRMYGFQICELLKRNESLRSIVVVLVGSVNNPDRYRRAPSDLYGADAYIEEPESPEGLLPILQRFALLAPERDALPHEADQPVTAPVPSEPPVTDPQRVPAPPAPTGPDTVPPEAEAKAARLARIIVSDIILYNEDRFAEAVRQGNVLDVMGPDLEEGRRLFEERTEESVRAGRDHLAEELLRVARQRGAV